MTGWLKKSTRLADALIVLFQKIGLLCDAAIERLTVRRFIRLQVVAVYFVQPLTNGNGNTMSENIGIDVPAGKIARLQFKPVNETKQTAKLDGPIEATVLGDSSAAELEVGGVDGLVLDIKLPETEGSMATIEVSGDSDLDPQKREVLTTIVTVRRLGDVPGKAVSLGATVEATSFPNADQFGVFDGASAGKRPVHERGR